MGVQHSEADLVRAAQRGDRDAFASLYEANAERVYHYLLSRTGHPADAQDITAEVFIRAMEAISSYKPKGVPFIAWLFRIAHNQAVNHAKKRARRREVLLSDGLRATSNGTEEDALRHLASQEVAEAMKELTELQRQVLTLRFAGQLSIAETARVMGRTEEAIKSIQHSALRALRRAMERPEVYEHAG